MKQTIKNGKIIELFDTLCEVDRNSPDLDIAIRFKNKSNFRKLKELVDDIMAQRSEIIRKYGKQKELDGKLHYIFKFEDGDKGEVDNFDKYNDAIKQLMDIETELELTRVPVVITVNKSGVGSAKGLCATTSQLDILESIFDYSLEE